MGVLQASGEACVSAYAEKLLECNLRPLVPPGRRLELQVVIPEGRRLAERTSNAAFGVVDGLALIGTQAEVQRSAGPDQLVQALAALRERAAAPAFCGDLVLVIGENGLDLAPRLGLPPDLLLKAGNWLGPLLVAAAEAGVRRLLLLGYQGKLIKLAGGIFHTHHHLADGRAEVLTALAALAGLGVNPCKLFTMPPPWRRPWENWPSGTGREPSACVRPLRRRWSSAACAIWPAMARSRWRWGPCCLIALARSAARDRLAWNCSRLYAALPGATPRLVRML